MLPIRVAVCVCSRGLGCSICRQVRVEVVLGAEVRDVEAVAEGVAEVAGHVVQEVALLRVGEGEGHWVGLPVLWPLEAMAKCSERSLVKDAGAHVVGDALAGGQGESVCSDECRK